MSDDFQVYAILNPVSNYIAVDDVLYEEDGEATAEKLARRLAADGKFALLGELYNEDDIQIFVVYDGEEVEVGVDSDDD